MRRCANQLDARFEAKPDSSRPLRSHGASRVQSRGVRAAKISNCQADKVFLLSSLSAFETLRGGAVLVPLMMPLLMGLSLLHESRWRWSAELEKRVGDLTEVNYALTLSFNVHLKARVSWAT